jgi:hypothetical protein
MVAVILAQKLHSSDRAIISLIYLLFVNLFKKTRIYIVGGNIN